MDVVAAKGQRVGDRQLVVERTEAFIGPAVILPLADKVQLIPAAQPVFDGPKLPLAVEGHALHVAHPARDLAVGAAGQVDLDHLAIIIGGVRRDGRAVGEDGVEVEIAAAEDQLALAIIGHAPAADLDLDRAAGLFQGQAGFGYEQRLPVFGPGREVGQFGRGGGDVQHGDDGVETGAFGLILHEGQGQPFLPVIVEGENVEVAIGPVFEVIVLVGRIVGQRAIGVEGVIRHGDVERLHRLRRSGHEELAVQG